MEKTLFERKGEYRVYDLKRVTSIKSLEQDLIKSEGQAPGALIKINRTGQARTIILAIKKYLRLFQMRMRCLFSKGKGKFQYKGTSLIKVIIIKGFVVYENKKRTPY